MDLKFKKSDFFVIFAPKNALEKTMENDKKCIFFDFVDQNKTFEPLKIDKKFFLTSLISKLPTAKF